MGGAMVHYSRRVGGGGRRRRRTAWIWMSAVVILVVVIATAVAVVLATGGDDDDDNDESASLGGGGGSSRIPMAVPTGSPTYAGEYHCPPGYTGPVSTRGCLGYVACDATGGLAEGMINYCAEGTLYDVDGGVCNHVDLVECTTKPLSTPAVTTTTSASASASASALVNAETILVPPVLTSGHRLLFTGSSSDSLDDDDVGALGMYLEEYLNEYYSPERLEMLADDDELRSLSDVDIGVTVTDLETDYYSGGGNGGGRRRRLRRRRRMRGGRIIHADDPDGDDARSTTTTRPNAMGRARARARGEEDVPRRLQEEGADEDTPTSPRWFVVVYDQTTSYRTTDASISIGTIVRRPFDDTDVASDLVVQLRSGFPDAFSTLTAIEYVEKNSNGGSSVADNTGASAAPPPAPSFVVATTTAVPVAPMPPPSETPTDAPAATAAAAAADTMEPTPAPSSSRPAIESSRAPVSPPAALLTVTGLLWLDDDGNGLFETTEKPLAGLFVNLRECDANTWKGTVQSDAIGQYVFPNLTEGSYYVDFLKPGDEYEFTIPKISGDGGDPRDSDVITQDSYKGSSDCLAVKEGFQELTNAGFVLKDEGEDSELAPAPSKAPASDPPTSTPVPEFCAFVSGQIFDFLECAFPCENQDDCPDDMLCAKTLDCPA